MMNITLNWVAEYQGPNPLAAGPLVVGLLRTRAVLDHSQVNRASADLWRHSGMNRVAHAEPSLECSGDALLALGRAAAEWAMAALNEVRGYVLHAGAARVGDDVRLYLGFHQPDVSRAALQLAVWHLVQLIKGQADQGAFKTELERLWQACRRHHPDYQARILMVAARELDLPYLPFLPGSRCWQFGWGARSRVFFETASNADGALGWQWQKNKVTSKDMMRALGFPTPVHTLVNHEVDLAAAAERVGFPCVVKPLDGGGGKGVTANINGLTGLQLAFRHARRFSPAPLMVEQHVSGNDYRLMVVNGNLVAAIEREASYLVGDGVSTVRELLRRLNASRCENLVRSRYLRPISEDEVLNQHLLGQGVDLEIVLPRGRKVSLRSNANRSTGGISKDVTNRVHPQVRAMAEQLTVATGLAAAGLDYLTTDITRPPQDVGGAFIEINATPGMSVCVAAGWTESAIARVVLGNEVGRIPVKLIILAPDAFSVQLQSLRNRCLGEGEGWVCGSELRVGEASMHVDSKRPWDAVRAALRNRRLQRLEVCCTVQDIERYGLPLDRFSRVNIQDSSLGQHWRAVLQSNLSHRVLA